jgi:hypothetical protein
MQALDKNMAYISINKNSIRKHVNAFNIQDSWNATKEMIRVTAALCEGWNGVTVREKCLLS